MITADSERHNKFHQEHKFPGTCAICKKEVEARKK